jgi:competence protein ComK
MYYIKRHEYGITLKSEDSTQIIHTSLIKYLNQLCLKNMTTYEGRIEAAKRIFPKQRNNPIYINENCILYQTKSIRESNTVLVNYFTVIAFKKVSNALTRFIFTNLDEEIMEVSYEKIMKQHSKIKIILEYLNNQKFS